MTTTHVPIKTMEVNRWNNLLFRMYSNNENKLILESFKYFSGDHRTQLEITYDK